jgi:putative ABC transport system ATP-binding protein
MWVSHDLEQAARMSERHLTMRAGVLAEQTAPRHDANPRDPADRPREPRQ